MGFGECVSDRSQFFVTFMPHPDKTPPKRKVGRPKGAVSLAAEARRMTLREYAMTHAHDVIDVWAEILKDPNAPQAARVAAGEKIMNRAVGQAAQAQPGEGDTADQILTAIRREIVDPVKKKVSETEKTG